MRKTKKLLSMILVAFLAITMSACSGTSGDGESGESGTSSSTDNLIKIEDIEWSVDQQIVDGDREIVFSLTNNSNYTISEIELTFVQADETTDEQIEDFYSTMQSNLSLSDEDLQEVKDYADNGIGAHVSYNIPITTSETMQDYICYFTGYKILSDQASFEYLEPDILTVYYVYNNTIYCEYYDYQSDSYSMGSYTSTANELLNCTNELKDLLPSLDEFDVIDVGTNEEGNLRIEVYGMDSDEYKTYLEAIKEAGFIYDVDEYNYIDEGWGSAGYDATNEEGYVLEISYYGSSSLSSQYNSMYLYIMSPDYEEE